MNYALIPTNKYVFRIQLHSKCKSIPNFCFGIFPKNKREKEFVGYSQMSYCERNNDWGISKIIKGRILNGDDYSRFTQKNIEIRVDLARRYLRASSYPGYSNVAVLDNPSRIEKDETYYFGIYLGRECNSVMIEDVQIVQDFDNRMG